jgi:hypothetical protein
LELKLISNITVQGIAEGAAKQYHDAIRQQKKKHWNDFLQTTITYGKPLNT